MKLKFAWLLCGAASLMYAACWTGPVTIPDNLSAEEIIQMAQAAMDRNRYRHAIQYYESIIQRFPYNDEKICDAEYGIASVHYKQKQWTQAKQELTAILEKYDGPGGGQLPKKYQILAKTRLEYLEQKQKILAED